MPQLAAFDDDGTVKFVGTITAVSDPVTVEDTTTYTVTAQMFDDDTEYTTTYYPLPED